MMVNSGILSIQSDALMITNLRFQDESGNEIGEGDIWIYMSWTDGHIKGLREEPSSTFLRGGEWGFAWRPSM